MEKKVSFNDDFLLRTSNFVLLIEVQFDVHIFILMSSRMFSMYGYVALLNECHS